MSDIPVISITKEFSDSEELDDVAKLNINEALTDTEDLIMEQDSVRYRKSPTNKCGNALVDAIQPTTNGSVTDVEDCTDSDEDEGEVKSAREAEITLDNFLDQGYVDETIDTGNKGAKPKTLTRCSSKMTDSNTLGVAQDTSAALTDCEDLSDDDDSLGHVSIPDCPEDILTRGQDNDDVAIHNVVKRRQDKHFHKQEAADASSSESDNKDEECKVRHRKCHRKAEDRPKSEYENLMMSDDETAGACAKPSNRRSALFDAEELVMEGSDVEEDKPQAFPEINITFVSDDKEVPAEKPSRKRPASLGVQAPNPDEAVTDVENLNSSDSEEEAGTTPKRLMPRAVVKGKAGGGTTDVEDFNDSDDNEENEPKNEVSSEFLPSPVREIAIVKHDECGEQRQNVMPLNQGMLTVRTPDMEQALTDVEDMSDTEEVGEMYDSSKYTIESLPEMAESDNVYSSDNTRVNSGPTLEVTSPARDPVTDTEDLFFEQSASTGGSGSELRRRRKTKQCHSSHGSSAAYQQHQQQPKGKKYLEMKCETAAADTTDVEDMYLSDDTAKKCGFERTKQRRATIQFSGLMAAANDADGKTDVEFLSGDELVCERSQSPLLYCDGYSSVVKTKERNGPISQSEANDVRPVPMIRKISPSPDAPQNCNTDVEDIQGGSDGEELNVTYSRAQTATPFELTRDLKESGSCEIYETSPRAKNELLDIKGMEDGNQPEIHTDVESLDDVEQ